jgi:hypothetical protein
MINQPVVRWTIYSVAVESSIVSGDFPCKKMVFFCRWLPEITSLFVGDAIKMIVIFSHLSLSSEQRCKSTVVQFWIRVFNRIIKAGIKDAPDSSF